ncbi:uncharacterized protein LOC112052419 [Bicyclus anynana]|uniref:Uncharacterized protein LOC112052419 n=1 Tax=Bicyclus anynana TaxID=110368 RepID=A0A6J1NQU7_BICAN|nr:uncharacterized protein LOC112052419 [Bicyclus anynana]XP_023947249.2 uncharacterized protein LOC112052419 [Bicyclus anynana]
MAPLLGVAETLGQKHRKYNELVNDAIKNNPNQEISAINHEESDLDNLFKIDVACSSRNVEFILQTLKCDDMLYVSRAIKKSTWLLTEEKYSHIINPAYLHSQLYPQMTSKAFNKLILHIRLNLRDEQRVEDFFNYYQQIDLIKAFNWLSHCSIPFIEKIIRNHAEDIPRRLWKRLYEKSITCLELLLQYDKSTYYRDHVIAPGLFFLNKHDENYEKFLNIIESVDKTGDAPMLGPKYTKIIMEKNPERIKNNLEKYDYILNIPVFAKYLKQDEVKEFVLTHIKNKETRSLFTFKKIKYFLNQLPSEERFDFVQKLFIEKSYADEKLDSKTWDDIVEYCNLPLKGKLSSSKNIYSWYVYAPFNKAMADLIQLIRKESNPTERLWILRVLLTCADKNRENILKLLKYYHENHINEAFLYKVQFVNHLITKTDTHRYDEEAWGLLNDLFNSLEVYTRSKDSVETCVKSIFFYNLIHDNNIPEMIENKIDFESYIEYEYRESLKKFNTEEREKIFNYLYKYYFSKITNHVMNEDDFNNTVEGILNILKVMDIWHKDLKEYPLVLRKVTELAIMKTENSWSRDFSEIYNFRKSWRKLFFPESIVLSFSQNTCINALKHNPELLDNYWRQLNSRINDNTKKNVKENFDKFHSKLRIYWNRSLAESFKATFTQNFNQSKLHKASVRGQCILLSPKDMQEFIQKYAPKETKIVSSQVQDMELSIRKNIATCMHRGRPHPPLEIVLLYAKGDYLKYVLPSLNAIFYNISCNQIRKYIPKLLNSPVSLQKHGIRIVFAKLNHKELTEMFPIIWKSNKNKSIRKTIFCETYKSICRQIDETAILKMWEMLTMFIDDLTFEENKKIYVTLSQTEKVPLSIKPEFYMKGYEFLKKIPPKANCDNLIKNMNKEMPKVIEFLDVDFMSAIFLENMDKKFAKRRYDLYDKVATYLLCTKSESVQSERYEKLFEPLIDRAIDMWNEEYKNTYYTRQNLFEILTEMSTQFEGLVLQKKMVIPVAMYHALLNKLQSSLSIKDNYVLITYVKLSLGYIQSIYNVAKCTDSIEKENFNNLLMKSAPSFGFLCSEYLKDDIEKHSSSVYVIFAHVLNEIIRNHKEHDIVYKMTVLKYILESSDLTERYALVAQLIPEYNFITEDDEKVLKLELLNKIGSCQSKEASYWHARMKDFYF